jgi:small subunit ribosomal protein S8
VQTDPLADFLTAIRNASASSKDLVLSPYSRMKSDVANILKEEGYVRDVEVVKEGDKQALKVSLKSDQNLKAITGLKRVSRPGLRRYVSVDDIPRVLGGLGVAILSTSRGVMSDQAARKANVGGELLLFVW